MYMMFKRAVSETRVPSKSELRQQAAEALARTPDVRITKLPPGEAAGAKSS
jgi:hypothetical protein